MIMKLDVLCVIKLFRLESDGTQARQHLKKMTTMMTMMTMMMMTTNRVRLQESGKRVEKRRKTRNRFLQQNSKKNVNSNDAVENEEQFCKILEQLSFPISINYLKYLEMICEQLYVIVLCCIIIA